MAKEKDEYKKDVKATSLANLKPANRKGIRNRITKKYVETMSDFLMSNHKYFLSQMAMLNSKDYVQAHIKLMEMVFPKQPTITATEETDKPEWIIQVASSVELPKRAELEAKNDDTD